MRLVLPVAAVVVAGIALSVYGVMAPPHIQPPLPSAGQHQAARDQPSASPVTSLPPRGRALTTPAPTPAPGPRRSAPVRVAVPALEISSNLGPARGLKPDGTVDDAPLSGPTWSLPWWYEDGPAPGQHGSAVILGHVDSALGAGHLGVFFKLGDLQPGQQITVTLADGSVTRWVIASIRLYPDGHFPNAVVYDRSGPVTLRLVTCGGSFDWQTHEYDSAIVVTARPVRATPDPGSHTRLLLARIRRSAFPRPKSLAGAP